MRTFTPKPADINRAWHVIDAEGQVLGKVATEAATLLRGKHKPIWAPHVDAGDHVVVVNAAKLDLSARKLADKRYYRHSGYPGGLRSESLEHLLGRDPERVVRLAVRGMLPKGPLGRQMMRKLRVYGGPTPPAPRAAAPAARSSRSRARERLRGVPVAQAAHPDHRTAQGSRRACAAAPGHRRGHRQRSADREVLPDPRPTVQSRTEPLRLTQTADVYDVDATLDGGGVSGQAGALRLGIARALVSLDDEARPQLKKAGLLTRDAREKERRKYGLKKARKAPQYSKR